MKKLLTFFFIGFSFLGYSQQKFQLTDGEGNLYADKQTIYATITEDDLDKFGCYIVLINVENLINSDLTVNSKRTNIVFVPGMDLQVCFGSCCDESVYEIGATIDADLSVPFEIKLFPNGYYGLNKFRFEFWSEEDQSDKITLYVDIDMTQVEINELNNSSVSFSAFPNPVSANSMINVSYTLTERSADYYLIIRNLFGAQVLNIPISCGENFISVDISTLVSGIYFYSIENKNLISVSKKLIVK